MKCSFDYTKMMKSIAILVALICCNSLKEVSGVTNITRVRTLQELQTKSGEFVVLDFIGLVEQHNGYTAEEYDVQTDDGYILKLHRISGSPMSPKAPNKPVVYIGHGMFESSDFYVVLGPKHDLAFLLADAGYDVWIGNFRGNTYSKRHINYSSARNNNDFWKFSMDEIGTIDLPILIDTVLEKTNQKKLTYIGYSMGSTVGYILLTMKPEYNDKINLAVNIAPVVIFSKPFSLELRMLLLLKPIAKTLTSYTHFYELLPQSKVARRIGKICASYIGKKICGGLLKSMVNPNQMNMTVLPTVFSHFPAGVSVNTLLHYYQMIVNEKFSRFDYGSKDNQLKYGSDTPPEYDLTKVSSPQAIFYSETDDLVPIRDVESLKNKLQHVVALVKVDGDYKHLDYMWNQNARNDVYKRVLKVVDENARQLSAR